jgi:cellulose synthase/poly-beta-1,6-N-acetylglucosamine synthase-like glycosyltransferase
MNPSVSVIIAVRNGASTIKSCLDSALALQYTPYDIIVVDDGSTDATGQILNGYGSRITVINHEQSRGPSAARNEAAGLSHSEFVAFTDGDCIVASDWLDQLRAGFIDPQVVSCGGSQRLPADATPFEHSVFSLMQRVGFMTEYVKAAQQGGIRFVGHNPSCTVMYRREVFLSSGGFLESLWPGEDVELDRRLTLQGHRHAFNPGAVVDHYRPRDLKAFWAMMKRYGCAQGYLARKFGFFRRVQYVPGILLGIFFLYLWVLLIAPLLSAGAALLFLAVGFAYFRGWRVFFLAVTGISEWCEGFLIGFCFPHKALRA